MSGAIFQGGGEIKFGLTVSLVPVIPEVKNETDIKMSCVIIVIPFLWSTNTSYCTYKLGVMNYSMNDELRVTNYKLWFFWICWPICMRVPPSPPHGRWLTPTPPPTPWWWGVAGDCKDGLKKWSVTLSHVRTLMVERVKQFWPWFLESFFEK